MTQSLLPTSPRISSDRWTEPVVIGKHSGPIEVQFSANDIVRTFGTTIPPANNRRIYRWMPYARRSMNSKNAKRILPTDEWNSRAIRGQGD